MKRFATAVWKGDGMSGTGKLTTTSGALADLPYSFKARFQSEDGKMGTNPEELIGAAHAGCFAMALSFGLANAGFTAEELNVQAGVDMEKQEAGFAITGITLSLTARIPGIDQARFAEIAQAAKAGCPVSKALSATPISLDAKLM